MHDLNLRPFKSEVTKNSTEDERATKGIRLLHKAAIKKVDKTWFTDKIVITGKPSLTFLELLHLSKCYQPI